MGNETLMCYLHTEQPAMSHCNKCGTGLCRDCIDAFDGTKKNLCFSCAREKILTERKNMIIGSVIGLVLGIIGGSSEGNGIMNGLIMGLMLSLVGASWETLRNLARSVSNRFSTSETKITFFIITLICGAGVSPFITIYKIFKLVGEMKEFGIINNKGK